VYKPWECFYIKNNFLRGQSEMIWLDRKEEFKRIIRTLNPWNLEFIGAFEFFTLDKKIVKLKGAEIPKFCLYLSTKTGEYGSTVTVDRKNYDRARVGKPYGLCGVIGNLKHEDFIMVTENTDPDIAIKQMVGRSWAKLFFIMVVLSLCLGSLLIFLYPLLHISWN